MRPVRTPQRRSDALEPTPHDPQRGPRRGKLQALSLVSDVLPTRHARAAPRERAASVIHLDLGLILDFAPWDDLAVRLATEVYRELGDKDVGRTNHDASRKQ